MTGFDPFGIADRPAASVTYVMPFACADCTTVLPASGPPVIVCVKRLRPPPSMTFILWSTSCSAIDPSPPAAFVSSAQAPMSPGPWQPRSEMCEASTAGVASVISAVETSPTFLPACWASSRIVLRFVPGTPIALLGPCEMRSSSVLWPVAQDEPVEAESGS